MVDNVFYAVKSSLDIEDVAGSYGIDVKHHKCRCPFHDDNTPSLSFKNGLYRCWTCNIGGDVIDFTQRLFNLEKPFDAVKKLNTDFRLNLIQDKLTANDQQSAVKAKAEREHLRKIENAYNSWLDNAFDILTFYYKKLRAWRERYAPEKMGGVFHPLYIESLQEFERVEYLLDILIDGDDAEKFELYANSYCEVANFEQRIEILKPKSNAAYF